MAAIGETIENSDFYVTYDNIKYIFKDLIETIECSLQIHLLFDIQYQKQSEHFWTFMENYFYDLEKKGKTAKNMEIRKLIDDLKVSEKQMYPGV